jgi:5-methylcytosine-specific restriction endonuclease McrA
MQAERERLGKETQWTCFYCHRVGDELNGPDERAWHVDHSYPISRGGDNKPDNLVLACATCNLQKHSRSALEYLKLMDNRETFDLELVQIEGELYT